MPHHFTLHWQDERQFYAGGAPAKACFDEIGESKLKFSLSVWTEEYVGRPGDLRSDINYAIAKKFAEKGLGLNGLTVKEPQPEGNDAADAKTKSLPKQGKSAA